jgi:hypothetical protein
MIALCSMHHAQAEAWTVPQMREMKVAPQDRAEVQGRFQWMREDVLAVIGGNFFYETPHMVVFRGEPMIWFERDEDMRLLLNLRVLTASGLPRTRLENNDWFIRGDPVEVESPPNGARLRVRYENGDDVGIRFREWSDSNELGRIFPRALALGSTLNFPLVTAEINVEVGGTNIKFGPTSTQLPGVQITGSVVSHCGAGFVFG